MGQYKVPQNVEVEDKILGPFSFRQFIYLLIAAGSGFLVWLLGSAFWALGIIPLPILIAALALALPLRKDQPMEIYLMAIIRFLITPKKRLWSDGSYQPNIDIDTTTSPDNMPIKDIRGPEASERLSFLAGVLDTAGWSTRGVNAPEPVNSNIDTDVANEAITQADKHDSFEDNSSLAQSISQRLSGGPAEANVGATAAPTSAIMRNNNA
jgi:hypothetical protein